MTDLAISLGAALAVSGVFGVVSKSLRSKDAGRVRTRLGTSHNRAVARRERSALLAAPAERFKSMPVGELLYRHAAKSHPSIPFSDFLAMLLTSVIGGALAGWVLFAAPAPAVLFAAASPITLDRVLAGIGGRRAARLERAIPGVLMVQAAAMRAGRSLAGSLRIAAREAESPLKDELAHAVREITLGRPFELALEALSVRCGSRDVELWVTAMQVHRQTGGDLPSVLDGLSSRIRERIRFRGELSALTAQGRLSGLVVGGAPLGFFVLLSITARDQMSFLYSTKMGFLLLVVGLALEIAGFIWIRAILRAAR